MTDQDHIEYLWSLFDNYGKGNLVAPTREGAFYFGRYLNHDEYFDLYFSELKKMGLLDDESASIVNKSE